MKVARLVIVILLVIIVFLLVKPETIHRGSQLNGWTTNSTLEIIHQRKSVRHYLDKSVKKEDLLTLIKAGMAAPTAGDRRPWEFVGITDKKVLKELGQALPYGQMLKEAGGAIVVCGVPEKSYPGEAREFWVQDCSAATENILLAAEAKGLGAVWIGVYPIKKKMEVVSRITGIPEGIVPLNVVSIGYPEGVEKPKDKFNPEQIHWNSWK